MCAGDVRTKGCGSPSAGLQGCGIVLPAAIGRHHKQRVQFGRLCGGADRFVPELGDLLFQDLDSGALCDAIEQVTIGFDGTNLSHVGLVAKDPHRGLVVIEAVSAGVVATPLHTFLARSLDDGHRPKVLVGRVNSAMVPDRHRLIRRAIEQARELEGKGL